MHERLAKQMKDAIDRSFSLLVQFIARMAEERQAWKPAKASCLPFLVVYCTVHSSYHRREATLDASEGFWSSSLDSLLYSS